MIRNQPDLAEAILALCAARGEEKSICPSEVARALAGNDEKQWRLLMHPIRETALALAQEGKIVILRKGRSVDPATMPKGVIRLRIGP
jgi:hypothetical protein